MISVINYGLGNISAFTNIFKRLNVEAQVVNNTADLDKSTKIILPGVGAFDHAMSQLNNSGLREKLDYLVLEKKIPVLGICVGMQMLANSSDEGKLKGLGWIDAKVKKFDINKLEGIPMLPHMGWNSVIPKGDNKLLQNLDNDSLFYFLHSYYFECVDESSVIATTVYGLEFDSAVNSGNIYGVQFHPEKSHQNGVNLLQNFANL